MMNFELLEASIINLLGNSAGGQFRVIGYQKQAQDAFYIKDEDRSVQVFYLDGEYPKSAGSLNGPMMHDMTFALYLTVSKPAKGNLAAINNPLSTAQEYITAAANLELAEPLVNKSWNELKRLVYQILMDARNLDLGLAPTRVANRWIDRAMKDPLQTRGELAILTGSMRLTARMPEEVLGEVGSPLTIFDTGIELQGDVIGRAGVYQEHDIVVEDTTGDIVLDPVSGKFLQAA